jgi:hypothetical protein
VLDSLCIACAAAATAILQPLTDAINPAVSAAAAVITPRYLLKFRNK